MLGGRLSPVNSLSALEMVIQILPSVEKAASNIYENMWIKAESASSKHTAFRSRNMVFGYVPNKQKNSQKNFQMAVKYQHNVIFGWKFGRIQSGFTINGQEN